MVTVYPTKHTRFCNSFCAASDNISEGLSTSRAAAADVRWEKWAAFCRYVALNPLSISHRDPVPILNDFASQYRTVAIAPIDFLGAW